MDELTNQACPKCGAEDLVPIGGVLYKSTKDGFRLHRCNPSKLYFDQRYRHRFLVQMPDGSHMWSNPVVDPRPYYAMRKMASKFLKDTNGVSPWSDQIDQAMESMKLLESQRSTLKWSTFTPPTFGGPETE